MFKKEAKERTEEKYACNKREIKSLEAIGFEKGFQEGAEFGYNEGFKDCAKSRLNVTTISDCPIKDDWHYVKDGLPEELHDVLCFVIHNEHRYVLQGYLREGRWVLSPLGTYLNNDDVIAWKEIVLPELPKESE